MYKPVTWSILIALLPIFLYKSLSIHNLLGSCPKEEIKGFFMCRSTYLLNRDASTKFALRKNINPMGRSSPKALWN